MRPSAGLVGLVLLLAPTVLAQGIPDDKTSVTTTTGDKQDNAKPTTTPTEKTEDKEEPKPTEEPKTEPTTTEAPSTTQGGNDAPTKSHEKWELGSDAPTIAGYGVPDVFIPDTLKAPYMQKSNLPDGTVFICVGAALGFFGAAILAWRGLVAWSLARSVKRAAVAQNAADMKAMTATPGKKRGLYNVVGASSNLSLDHLSAAPPGTSRPTKPFAGNTTAGTPPNSSLFFSPTAGGAAAVRDSIVNRSSTYLPAGYYASGTAQPAQGSPMTHVGGHNHAGHLSTHSLATPGNRFSHRSNVSPPASPSLPPSSRGYDRAPPSRDGLSMYNRNSVATMGGGPPSRGTLYGETNPNNVSQLSLNVAGGTSVAGGRAPSAYLEDLFENHGNGARERF